MPMKGMNVPIACIEAIWHKAAELLQTDSAMVPAPGQSPDARMVLSYSGKQPHLVVPSKKGGGFDCDTNCPSWKCLRFCSHTVAVAELHGKLGQLVSRLQHKKKVPNLTSLLTSCMLQGRDQKGCAAPRKWKRTSLPETRVPMSVPRSETNSSGAVVPTSTGS